MKKLLTVLILLFSLTVCKQKDNKDNFGNSEGLEKENQNYDTFTEWGIPFKLVNIPAGYTVKLEEEIDEYLFDPFIYDENSKLVGYIKVRPWTRAFSPAIGESDLNIDGVPVYKEVNVRSFWDLKEIYTYYSFESEELLVIINATIINELSDWFEENFKFVDTQEE